MFKSYYISKIGVDSVSLVPSCLSSVISGLIPTLICADRSAFSLSLITIGRILSFLSEKQKEVWFFVCLKTQSEKSVYFKNTANFGIVKSFG